MISVCTRCNRRFERPAMSAIRTCYDCRNAQPVPGLTPQRRRVLTAVREFRSANGYPPTVREIGAACGLSSSSTVAAHIDWLIRAGLLAGEPKRCRTLRVTERGERA